MKPALLLIDLQNDYVEADGLVPSAHELIDGCGRLLEWCRRDGVPVIHSRTIINPDGGNRMPHWKRADYWACVEGTTGCASPPRLAPVPGEEIIGKTFYSAFTNPALEVTLERMGTDLLVLAGVYLHACVCATALDAYARGFEVWIARDAVASMTVMQTVVAQDFLHGRAGTFLESSEIRLRLKDTV